MNQRKKKDQNFLPNGANALLEGIHAIILAYRMENNIPETRFATEAGLNKNSLGVVEEEVYTAKHKRSTIDLLTLAKILNHYPNLKIKIGEYLSDNKKENITSVHELNELKDKLDRLRDELLECYRARDKERDDLKKNVPYTPNQP